MTAAAGPLDFWFDFASTYSYVAAMRVEQVASARGITVAWRPFLLGPIFQAQLGIKDSPFNAFPVRGRYMWRDVERLCAKYGIPWRRPSAFPRNGLLAARVRYALGDDACAPEFCRRVFAAGFAEDRDVADAEVVAGALRAVGRDPEPLLAAAAAPEAKARLRAATDAAVALGLFGAPSFVAAGELFFGQDRLEDAVAWCARAEGEGGHHPHSAR